jgi:hypothetical protein
MFRARTILTFATIQVWTLDAAGNQGPVTEYTFEVAL